MAQQQMPDRELNAALQREIIDSVSAALQEVYVFPDVAEEMENHLREKYQNNRYDDITSAREFGRQLTEDLREISHDLHLGVTFMSDELIARVQADTSRDAERNAELLAARRRNFDFVKVERLDGNIGYIRLDSFQDATYAGPTAIAAMNFLAYCDAIIFDLRYNGGGSPSMIQLISSYFFDEPTHLNSFYIRKEDTVYQFWTQAHVQGPRMTDAEVYVLTSSQTFSGAEEFSYNMRNLERGTLIGETTGGGAHPVEGHIFANLNFGVRVPFGRAINPISGTNWEGAGVEPHIAVPADSALDVAVYEATKSLLAKADDEDRRQALQWTLDGLKAKHSPVTISQAEMQEYVGTYGPRKIFVHDGTLCYQREDRPQYNLVPMGNDTFLLPDLDYFRIHFERGDDGSVTKIVGLYDNGQRDSHERTN